MALGDVTGNEVVDKSSPTTLMHATKDMVIYRHYTETAQIIAGGQTDLGQKLLLGYNTTTSSRYSASTAQNSRPLNKPRTKKRKQATAKRIRATVDRKT